MISFLQIRPLIFLAAFVHFSSSIELCEFSIFPQSCTPAKTIKVNDYFVLYANEGSWPSAGFCRVVSSQFSDQNKYVVSADLLNFNSKSGPGSGHPGLMYNAKDDNNFDFVYFRPHSTSTCYQTGYVKNGALKWDGSKTSVCTGGPPKGGKWFSASVKVEGNAASIFMNDQLIVTVQTKLPNTGKGGVLVANGYQNTIYFKNLKISSTSPLIHIPGFTVSRCLNDETVNGYHVLDARHGAWPADGFCQAVSDWSGGMSDYSIAVKLYNVIGWQGIDSGHPGLMYNVVDGQNYDFVYFRPHNVASCYQTGYVLNGVPKFGKSSTCPGGQPRGGQWFDVRISVTIKKANIYLNNQLVISAVPHYQLARVGGVIVANGYKNLIRFKEFTLISQ